MLFRSQGRSALTALAELADTLTVLAIDEDEELTVTPTQLHVGDADNIVPPAGWIHCDVRAFHPENAKNVLALIPEEIGGVRIEAELTQRFPALDSRESAPPTIRAAEDLLGLPLLSVSRGGSADVNFFAGRIPLALDGLGPVGSGDHTSHEYVLSSSFLPRTEVALALAISILTSLPTTPLGKFGWVREQT